MFSADYVDNDVAEYARKLERALPDVKASIGPDSEGGAGLDDSDEVHVEAQMLAYKKADEAFSLVESHLSSGALLPPLLAAFAVEVYRYHMPYINAKLSPRAKTTYELLESLVWAHLSDNNDLLDEVVRKWQQIP